MDLDLSIDNLKQLYQSGKKTPSQIITQIYPFLQQQKTSIIHLISLETLLKKCKELETNFKPTDKLFYGIFYAAKDNIDIENLPTTAACPDFNYIPTRSARIITLLNNAGCICIGKTNMDQFACGLVGTRSPYGIPKNALDHRFTPGGSSSGSASLIGNKLLTFCLGTDTAGSGRVPAMFNGCVGIKPSVGLISIKGVVPACYSIDCISIFCKFVADGTQIAKYLAESCSEAYSDPTVKIRLLKDISFYNDKLECFNFAIPQDSFLDFSSPGGNAIAKVYKNWFMESVKYLEAMGGKRIEMDYTPFFEAAKMLYGRSFVSERISGIKAFLTKDQRPLNEIINDNRILNVTRKIISSGLKYSAIDYYDDYIKLKELKSQGRDQLKNIDILLVPTAPAHYTIKEIEEEEGLDDINLIKWEKNSNLGRFTNFVNIFDMCGVSIPVANFEYPIIEDGDLVGKKRETYLKETGGLPSSLPFGITLVAKEGMDEFIWKIADQFQKETKLY